MLKWYTCGITAFVLLSASTFSLGSPFGGQCRSTCKRIADCPSAVENLEKSDKMPSICYVKESVTYTCCDRSPGDISKQKCLEYSKYSKTITRDVALSFDDEEDDLVESNECAILHIPLIFGGTEADVKEFPHMAMIGYKSHNDIEWNCGGALVSENFVLTAGHCLYDQEHGEPTHVKLGITNVKDNSHKQQIRIKRRIKHPEYRPPSHYNDIALLELEEPAKLNPYVRPACLYTSDTINKERVLVSGFGKTETSQKSEHLLKTTLELFKHERCKKAFKKPDAVKLRNGIVENQMICAGSSTEEKDTCRGDSGAPLLIFHDSKDGAVCMYDIVGVVSFGKICGRPNVPSVYTRVSNYIEWIEGHVWPVEENDKEL